MHDLCVVLLAPAVITIRSGAFQPLFCISSSNGAYFLVFSSNFSCENLSLVFYELYYYVWYRLYW